MRGKLMRPHFNMKEKLLSLGKESPSLLRLNGQPTKRTLSATILGKVLFIALKDFPENG